MSYAIIRNEKYTRSSLMGIYRHNERKNTNYTNKNINHQNTYKNYAIKKCDTNYLKKFDQIRQENNLKGWIKKNSNVVCEYIITSDNEYFNRGTEYQADTNRIIDPFYTIDYAIDNVLALSFYKKEKESIKDAFDLYIKLCKDGGTLSLKEIIKKYNLDNPFEKDALKNMCNIIKEDIKILSLRRK